MVEANAMAGMGQQSGMFAGIRAFDRWLRGSVMRWVALPFQIALRLYVFFTLPFINSGLTKWEIFPFLKPETWTWNGWPQVSAAAKYQFGTSCDFCFNIRIWGTEQNPLVQWVMPYPDKMAAIAGFGEIIFPALILVGLLTRISALGLLVMTIVIQLVLPTGLPIHATWAAAFIGIIILGPGMISLDGLIGRVFRR